MLLTHKQEWGLARRWWGKVHAGQTLEIDVVAESSDGTTLLVGEAKLMDTKVDIARLQMQLQEKAAWLPFAKRYRQVQTAVFVAAEDGAAGASGVVTLRDALSVLT
jgi:hypothetical protein